MKRDRDRGGIIGGERWEEEQLKILFKLYEIKDFEIFLLNFEFWECCEGNYASNVFFSFTILSHSSSSLLLFYLTHLLLFYYFISLSSLTFFAHFVSFYFHLFLSFYSIWSTFHCVSITLPSLLSLSHLCLLLF